jgi:uncharacterized membrane protein (UPF0182 family)
MLKRTSLKPIILIGVGIGLLLELVSALTVEILWYQELSYLSSFIKRLISEFALFWLTAGSSFFFLSHNLKRAEGLQWHFIPEPAAKPQRRRRKLRANSGINPQSRSLKFSLLLGWLLGFCLLISLMLIYYTQVAIEAWTPDFTLPKVTPPLPHPFNFGTIPALLPFLTQHIWVLAMISGVFIGVTALVLTHHRFWLWIFALIQSIVFGTVMAGNWTSVLTYWHAPSFGAADPQFSHDISFYVFKLPVWKLLDFWIGGMVLYGLIAVGLTYLLSADSLAQGKFPGFSQAQLRHLYWLGGLMMIVVSLRHWFARYQLLFASDGVVYGAGYTNVYAQLPLETLLSLMAIAIALWLIIKSLKGAGRTILSDYYKGQKRPKLPFSSLPFYLYFGTVILSWVAAFIVQNFIVQPNELARERPYIQRSIALTRAAFNLDTIQAQTLEGGAPLTAQDIERNGTIINNIRVWDARPLLQANRQLQQIRPYFKFPDADYDRYSLKEIAQNDVPDNTPDNAPNDANNSPDTFKQQVLIAARELDFSQVPAPAQTWLNQHLIFTHGFGFTLSPVNLADSAGLPVYFVKNIGTDASDSALQTANPSIQASIPVENTRIYFGELTNTYIMTHTKVKEFDFPSGQDNAYNTYEGTGGIPMGNPFKRLLFATFLKDWQMLFTQNFTADTRLLIRRDINIRIRKLAPFLRFDRNPYLVAAHLPQTAPNRAQSSLFWIIDAYTTSDRYPYSNPGDRNFNYIRNSVKIVIDALNGDVSFYVVDGQDPIIRAWQQVFPKMFRPLAQMPAILRKHIRYPEDLFNTQSERLLTFHMLDPQVFYNREDQWRIPQEIYGSESQSVAPYYLLLKIAGGQDEFSLVHFYTPIGRNNLIAGLFALSDGKNYGKLVMYQLPKQRVIYGPEQIEALINQDPIISQQISLWNREGSKAVQGNLLIIPIEQSLLYVEPIYLEAVQNGLPTLVRVVVVYENQIVMARTLQESIQAIFKPKSVPSAIIRPFDAINDLPPPKS